MVSVLAFYSDGPSLIPVGYFNFLYKNTKINEKEVGVGPSLKKYISAAHATTAFHYYYACTLVGSPGQ